jgi:hypothetical protein
MLSSHFLLRLLRMRLQRLPDELQRQLQQKMQLQNCLRHAAKECSFSTAKDDPDHVSTPGCYQ